jgi:hypothetical protein
MHRHDLLLDGNKPLEPRLAPPRKWPAVIGLISVLISGIPILGSLLLLNEWARGRPTDLLEGVPWWAMPIALCALIYSLAMVLLLFLAGLGLALYKPWGRTLHLSFAWVSVVVFLLGMGLWFLYYPFGGYADPEYALHTWNWLKAWALCLWYPAFLLAWFCRPRVREEVNRW